jgi:tyrosine-protein kinase Etk/Wzc
MDNDHSRPFPNTGSGPAMNTAAPQPMQQASADEEDEGLALGEIIAVLMDYRWLIAAISLFALALGLAWVLVAKPVYRADGLLQIEEKGSGGALKALEPLLGDDTTVSAEVEILTSRMVLGRVVNKLKLDIVAMPRTLPLIGGAFARRYQGDEPNSAWLGFSSFAWGGERIQVDSLDVPPQALDQPHALIAREGGTFEVFDDDDRLVLKGKAGTRASDQGYSIFVAQLRARPDTQFRLTKRSAEAAIDDLRSSYSVKERGKKSGVLELSLLGSRPEQIALVLDDILNTYVRQNVERRSAEAEKTLKFLETQLPALKTQVDSAEAAYNSYRQSRGSLDLSLETQGILKSLVEVENAAVLLKQERDELRQSFTPEHPRIQAVDNKLARLNDRRKQFDGEVSRLPDTQQTVLRLARDVEVSNRLYTELLNTAQQLRVSKAGTVGDVRVIDTAAVARKPVGAGPGGDPGELPCCSACWSAWWVIWVLRSLRVVWKTRRSSSLQLGLPGVTRRCLTGKTELELYRKARGGVEELLAVSYPQDDAVESLRGLRTTLHFALLDAQRNSLLITGSSPGLGKSFISKNLGAVLAQVDKRVVIVDADLRRGHLHQEFGLERAVGVSEYVAGQASLEDLLKTTMVPKLSVVTTGQIPPNPSELLMHPRFQVLLSELAARFDTVIVDAPPVLAVSDAAIIGRHVGATLMVARAGKHPIRELEQAVKRLNQAGVQVKGFVFNDLNVSRQNYRYGYKGYVYRYSYKT